jgi:hypothetical protein
MDTRVFCVYNLARRVLLSSKVTVAHGASQPLMVLKVLVSGVGVDAESGLWLAPLSATPILPRIFPYDLVYLDKDYRVLETIEVHPGVDFPTYRREVASAVVLPQNTLRSTQTQRGDRLVVCLQQEIDAILADVNTTAAALVNGDRKPAKRVPARTSEPAPTVASGVIADAPPVADQVPAKVAATAEIGVLVAESPLKERPSVEAEPIVQALSSVSVAEPEAPVTAPPMEQPIVAPASAAAKPATISISETVIEQPQVQKKQPIAAHQGVVEDLFANWVESPLTPPVWIRQNVRPSAPEVHPPVQTNDAEPIPDRVAASAPPSEPPLPAKDKAKLGNEAVSESQKRAESQAVKKQTAASGSSNDRKGNAEASPPAASAPVESPVPGVISPPANATTFTVAQYSRWQLSTPTALSPIATGKRPATDGNADPVPAKQEKRAIAASPEAVQPRTKSEERPPARVVGSQPAKPPVAQSSVGTPPAEKKPLAASVAGKRLQIAEPAERKVNLFTPVIGSSASRATPESQNPKPAKAITASDSGKTQAPTPASGRDGRTEKIVEAAREMAPAEFARAVQDRLEKLLTNLPSPSTGTSAQKPGVAARKPEVAPAKPQVAAHAEAMPAKPKAAVPAEVARSKPEVLQEKKSEATKPVVPAKANPVWAGTVPAKPAEKTEAAPNPHNELSMTVPLPGFLKPKSEPKGKLKISVQRVETNGKNGAPPGGLAARFKRWLNHTPESQSDRRRALRRYVPGMVAHYYTGGAPKPYDVADISMSGFYLLTEDHWMPETMIRMTLQKPCAKGERKQSITVLSRVVRRGRDGVAAEFVMTESLDQYTRDVMPTQGTDRFSLARFL